MHALLGAARQAGKHATSAARPWPSAEKPTMRTDRPDGIAAIRYVSVDNATHRLTATRRQEGNGPPGAFPQPTGRFHWWWQVLGSNQRRLSRRFYRPSLLPKAGAADQ